MFHLRSCKICFLKKKNPTCFSSYRMVFKPIHQMHQWSFQQPQRVVGRRRGSDRIGLSCGSNHARQTREKLGMWEGGGGGPNCDVFSPNLDLVEKQKNCICKNKLKNFREKIHKQIVSFPPL